MDLLYNLMMQAMGCGEQTPKCQCRTMEIDVEYVDTQPGRRCRQDVANDSRFHTAQVINFK